MTNQKVEQGDIQGDIAQIEEWYNSIQHSFIVNYIDESIGKRLLDSRLNHSQPVHSWYVLKEAYSFELPLWVIHRIKNNYSHTVEHVLDPFVGCGTTGVSLTNEGIHVDGLEYNPFIRFVAAAKSKAHLLNIDTMSGYIQRLSKPTPEKKRFSWPKLTTFHNEKYFRRCDVRHIRFLIDEINNMDGDVHAKSFLKIGIAKSLEQISNLRKDGRALRYEVKTERPRADSLIPQLWNKMLMSMDNLSLNNLQFNVYQGNAKNLREVKAIGSTGYSELPSEFYDLVLYSPPYLNNFDYTEIYKLELWMLDFISDYEEWTKLRKETIRSHPSVRFESTCLLEGNNELLDIGRWLRFVSSSKCLVGRSAKDMPDVILGYFDDMYLALTEQYRVLKPGGFLVYIVANSRHSYLPIATDIVLGAIARAIGFESLELAVLRKRNGRTGQKNYLRESAVFLRKPA